MQMFLRTLLWLALLGANTPNASAFIRSDCHTSHERALYLNPTTGFHSGTVREDAGVERITGQQRQAKQCSQEHLNCGPHAARLDFGPSPRKAGKSGRSHRRTDRCRWSNAVVASLQN